MLMYTYRLYIIYVCIHNIDTRLGLHINTYVKIFYTNIQYTYIYICPTGHVNHNLTQYDTLPNVFPCLFSLQGQFVLKSWPYDND